MAKKTTSSTTPTKGVPIGTIMSVVLIIVALITYGILSQIEFRDISLWWLIIITAAVVIAAAWYFRKKLPIGSLRYTTFPWQNILRALGALVLLLMVLGLSLSLYERWTKPKTVDPQQTSAPAEPVKVVVIDHRTPVLIDTENHLKAGTPYVLDRKCKTEYYFEPKEIGSALVTLKRDKKPSEFISFDAIRTSPGRSGTDMIVRGGEDPFVQGTYDLTVDRDITLIVRTEKVN